MFNRFAAAGGLPFARAVRSRYSLCERGEYLWVVRCLALVGLLIFALHGCVGVASAAEQTQDEFTVLQIDKQPSEPLSYFVRHAPVEAPDGPEAAAKFGPLPEGITAHLTEVGVIEGRHLFAIRYLSDARLAHGNTKAVGLVLLCSTPPTHQRFAPLVVAWDEGEVVDDYSVSPVRRFVDFSFVWLRREFSGSGKMVGRMAITAADASSPLRARSLFAEADPLADLVKEGWVMWHRGNYFDEERLTWHYHLYRDRAKVEGKDESPHWSVRIRYEFRDGKLHPGKPEEDGDLE